MYFFLKLLNYFLCRFACRFWNICFGKNIAIIAIIRWPPRKVTALQPVVRTSFLGPRPCLFSPPAPAPPGGGICFGTWKKIYMLTKWLHSSSPSIITCANCIAANRLQRKTSPQFFGDKVIARSRRPGVSHGSYNDTDVTLPSCLQLLAKLIVLFITYAVSGSVDQNMT